jgi:hypothetical protein
MNNNNKKPAIICCSVVVVIGLTIGILAWCASTVEPIAYGLKYNTLSKNIDGSAGVYEGGWYLVGPFSRFIQFPKTQVNVDFANLPGSKQAPIDARSGVPIKMSFSFQYQLIKNTLPKLYELHNVRYEKELILTTAEGVIKQEATAYNVTDYWTMRKQIGDSFCAALNKKFVYANCTGFQLLTIEMSDLNEQAIIKTQLAIQQGY